ncbi:hypothetical protein HW555_001715 [Spodoptera exigua]|uniref:Coiled-coil domain-containing protein 130 n=1 Tax=Spodoptera exigua TaxID=7107 RepID=A0A835LAY6_SPOEX|nr:hypothetical protein HW555_001715 [Spodoptera exigua]
MGERKGQNLYYPPDYDPKVGGLNKFMGTHALRERARKLHMGILIIRFEMPYNIWCEGCKNHIGMGVRYNAEKTKIGMYYSTPVYQFRMKCHLCDNHFEIKTDPGNLDYVIVSGARRQENRWDPTDNGQIVPETKETQKKLFDDAMFKLEHKTGDEETAKLDNPRLGRLVGRNESVWKDDYEANCSLRRNFRKRRKELEESSVNDSLLLAKSSLDISLLPENEDDRNMASLLSLRPSKSVEESQTQTRSKILNTPALPSSTGLLTSFGGLKKEESLSKSNSLTRQGLGITLKRSKILEKKSTEDRECISEEDSKIEDKLITESKDLKDDICKDIKLSEVPNKYENTDDQKKIDILNIKKDEVTTPTTNTNNSFTIDKVETKKLSLVCDYSSSDENSE